MGGVFYDDFQEGGFERSFAMTRAVGDAFLAPTCPSCSAAAACRYGERERDFRPTGAAATSSSTWCSTVARCSACKAAAAPRAS